jgi:hypothetical protein
MNNNNWSPHNLAEQSFEYMFKFGNRLDDSSIIQPQNRLNTIRVLCDKWGDVLYDIIKRRKRNKELDSM